MLTIFLQMLLHSHYPHHPLKQQFIFYFESFIIYYLNKKNKIKL